MKIGDIVEPIDTRNPLHCGSGWYPHAVVCSVEPFIMVSEETDMKWTCEKAEDYRVTGTASDTVLKNCIKKRLTFEEML